MDIGEEPERSNKPFRIRMTHWGPGAEWTVWVTNSLIALNIAGKRASGRGRNCGWMQYGGILKHLGVIIIRETSCMLCALVFLYCHHIW